MLILKPKDVNLSTNLIGTFGKHEVEISAVHLVRYLQGIEYKNWHFTVTGLVEYYQNNKLNPDEMLFGLLGSWIDDGPWESLGDPGYIIHWGSSLQVTSSFLNRLEKHRIFTK